MSERLNDYFANEAGEYLDQLERLLDLPGVPDADHLLRLATGVRGSAQMAQTETVARVAERLEDAARSMLTGDIAWSDELRSLASQTVADLKLLVRALDRWGPEEEERVRIAMSRWDGEESEAVPALAPRSEPNVVAIASLFYDDEGPHIIHAGAGAGAGAADRSEVEAGVDAETGTGVGAGAESDADLDIGGHADTDVEMDTEPLIAEAPEVAVPIEDLLLRGESALLEAIALRPTFERFARGDAVPDRSLADLVQELFDLVELGVTTERREE